MVDDDTSWLATFSEHNDRQLRDAHELSVLCEAKVDLLVFNNAGRQLDYCSTNTSWDALPGNMEYLTSLHTLKIHGCKNIRSLPTLPQSLKGV
ncbi:Lr21 [Hordeum vulgare]|nr:Lr21 [Hordeum vulgare]